MRVRTIRRGAVTLVAAALAVPAIVAAPAARASEAPTCTPVLPSTPPVTVDLDGDGSPEYSAPRVQDLRLCAEAGASYVVYPPTIERCGAGWHPTCYAVRISVLPVEVFAGAAVELCATVDGVPLCRRVETPALDYAPLVVCVGFDLNGGRPCSHGELLGFE